MANLSGFVTSLGSGLQPPSQRPSFSSGGSWIDADSEEKRAFELENWTNGGAAAIVRDNNAL